MMKNVILIDYENVHVEKLNLLTGIDSEVWVFVGPSQSTVPVELLVSAQNSGVPLKWVETSRQGKNALDFHIAYYLGQMSWVESKPYFHIVSKDKGYEALIEHMRAQKLFVDRIASLEELPLLKKKNAEEIRNLLMATNARPKKLKGLHASIKNWRKAFSDETVDWIANYLKQHGVISVDANDNVSYSDAEA